jgi:hypothetical protein
MWAPLCRNSFRDELVDRNSFRDEPVDHSL